MPRVYSKKEESASASRGVSSKAANVEDLRQVSKAQQILSQNQNAVQTHPADGAFVFYPNISGDVYKDRVPYWYNKICFAPYKGGEVRSAGFNGCYMMAFRFVESNLLSMDDAVAFNASLNIFDRSNPIPTDFDITYIAHVSNDRTARDALFDAENRGLVQIERIFRPYRSEVYDKPILDSRSLSPNNRIAEKSGGGTPEMHACINKFTGGMEKTVGGEWVSYVYDQERLFNEPPNLELTNFVWKNKNVIRYFDANALEQESIATKICLYASVAEHSNNSEIRNEASRKLNDLIGRYPELARYAKDYHFNATDTAKNLIAI